MPTPVRSRAPLAAAVAVVSLLVPLAPPARAQPPPPPPPRPADLVFAPPLDAPVTDGWRPPSTEFGPGNRGWEYTTEPDTTVAAAGHGTVTFAGQVGGDLHVTVAHRGGLRTTYSYLAAIAVVEGTTVRRGDAVGSTAERLHFGVRLQGEYIDPATLFRPGALVVRARLVDGPGPGVASATLLRRPGAPGRRAVPTTQGRGPPHRTPPNTSHRVLPRSPRAPGPGRPNRWEGARPWPS